MVAGLHTQRTYASWPLSNLLVTWCKGQRTQGRLRPRGIHTAEEEDMARHSSELTSPGANQTQLRRSQEAPGAERLSSGLSRAFAVWSPGDGGR